MPSKPNVRGLLSKHLGKDVADALLKKIDKMVKEGASPARIENTVSADIAAHIEKQVVSAVIAKVGPIQPIKVNTIQVSVKPAIKPTPSIKVSTGVSVKVGPPIYTRGAK